MSLLGLFGFDDKYAMFDITPVQNQFIAEYLPHAKGDHVKVWLYGLMQCYHPREDMDMNTMAHELEMTEDDVLAAFRYWERRGLVHRVSDKPLQYRYVNMAQLNAAAKPDPVYEAFGESIYGAFGNTRRLHGSEISECYEWVEELKLPPEVVIMLLKHMVAIKGKNFAIRSAEPLAARLAEAGVKTIEEAESILSVDRKTMDGTVKVLKRLGKRSRLPSEDEISLYRKWTQEWGFSADAIEAACSETVKGDPNFGYLDGILKKLCRQDEGKATRDVKDVEEAFAETNCLRELLSVLGRGNVNDTNIKLYREMRNMYPDDVILLAGRECNAKGEITDVRNLLASWKKRGLETEKEILDYVTSFKKKNELIHKLYEMWGLRGRGTAADRSMIDRWEQEYGFDWEQILFAAGYASGKEAPMAYLDKLLGNYSEKGIRTHEAMEQDRREHQEKYRGSASIAKDNRGRKLNAQQFEQREYDNGTDDMDIMMQQEAGTDA